MRGQQTRKNMCLLKRLFFPAQLKVIFSSLIVPQSSSQCGIPINFKRQISDRIISIENREKRLVGLGTIIRKKNVQRLSKISTWLLSIFFFFFWNSFASGCHYAPFWSFQGRSYLSRLCGFLILTPQIWIPSLISLIGWLCLGSHGGANLGLNWVNIWSPRVFLPETPLLLVFPSDHSNPFVQSTGLHTEQVS